MKATARKSGLSFGKSKKIVRTFFMRTGAVLALSAIFLLVAVNLLGFASLAMNAMFKKANASPVLASPESSPRESSGFKKMRVVVSAYSSLAYQTDGSPCITADGTDVCRRYFETQSIDTVAANFLPIGTRLRIPSLFPTLVFTVRDRMNPRYSYGYMDIWLPTKADAVQFGRRSVEIEILD